MAVTAAAVVALPLAQLLPGDWGLVATIVILFAVVVALGCHIGGTGVRYRPARSWTLGYLMFVGAYLAAYAVAEALDQLAGLRWPWLVVAAFAAALVPAFVAWNRRWIATSEPR
jgi:hypothetical protein